MLAGGVVAAAGTDEQRTELLGALASGDVARSRSRTPSRAPAGRRGAAAVTATGSGDGWTLSGVKEPVPHGARADLLVVSALLDSGATRGSSWSPATPPA